MAEYPKITIVLDHLRSAHNVGNIFRIAEAVNASEIICCGYTAAPPHPKLEKTAMGADKIVPCRIFSQTADAIRALREENYKQILVVDTLDTAKDAIGFHYEYPLALIFGNEALGVSAEAVSMADGAVSLPMLGMKASINVGNCAAVVLYEITHQIRVEQEGGKK